MTNHYNRKCWWNTNTEIPFLTKYLALFCLYPGRVDSQRHLAYLETKQPTSAVDFFDRLCGL